MKARFVFTLFLVLAVVSVLSAEEKTVTGNLKDGFLEKDYAISVLAADDAELELTKNLLNVHFIQLPEGYISLYSVGDSKGGPQKGEILQVKIVKKSDNLVTVGFKVGEGNLAGSQKFQQKFQQLVNAASKPK